MTHSLNSEAGLREAFDRMPVATLVCQNERIAYANEAAARLFGSGDAGRMIGKSPKDFLAPNSQPITACFQPTGTVSPQRRQLTLADHSVHTVVVSSWTISYNGDTAVQCLVQEIRRSRAKTPFSVPPGEIAERHGAELNAVLESIADAVYVGDLHGIYLCNRAALDMLGFETREELLASIASLAERIATRDPHTLKTLSVEEQPFVKALQGESAIREVLARNIRSGKDVLLRSAAAPIYLDNKIIGAVAVNTDITETRQTEYRLREAEAMAAVGRLAWQVAHEVNNPLQAATNLLTLAAHADVRESDRGQYLEQAQEQLQRTADVLLQLLPSGQRAEELHADPTTPQTSS
jgi:PAS domain S-box-containing protein